LLALGLRVVFCAAGPLSSYVAVKLASINNVGPCHYIQLVGGGLISYFIWHDKPSLWTLPVEDWTLALRFGLS
jgi:drug/metabolite transporter (DMT)-like permease